MKDWVEQMILIGGANIHYNPQEDLILAAGPMASGPHSLLLKLNLASLQVR